MVFIPANAKVDKLTGSKYEIDEQKRSVERTDYIEQLRQFIHSDGFPKFSEDARAILNSVGREGEISQFRDRLASEFGISDAALQEAILKRNGLGELNTSLYYDSDPNTSSSMRSELGFEGAVRRVLRNEGIMYVETKNPVSSQDYWENYFKQHEDKRPKRIVYYRGDDPSEAINEWRQKNNLTKRSQERDIGFSEREVVTGDDPNANKGIKRFESLAKEVIDEYFPEEAVAA